jgi:hypothetical protein
MPIASSVETTLTTHRVETTLTTLSTLSVKTPLAASSLKTTLASGIETTAGLQSRIVNMEGRGVPTLETIDRRVPEVGYMDIGEWVNDGDERAAVETMSTAR